MAVNNTTSETALATQPGRGRLFPKYVALFLAVVALALVPNALMDVWLSYQEQKDLLFRLQREQAKSAAEKIGQFVKEIEGQMSWATQLPVATESDEEWRFDAVRLLRQAPAVTEFTHLDASGRERFRMSREAMDVIGSLSDYSHDPMFTEAMANKVYYGPVYFVHGSEPYMTLAVAGARPDEGVVAAKVNLKFIWDVVSQIKVGVHGQAYVVDGRGQLIAHPDISLVLRKMDVSGLAQVQAARASAVPGSSEYPTVAADLNGRKVLTAYARVQPLGWLVFADLPIEEAYAPFYETLIRSGILLLAALAVAFFAGLFLARRMVVPIRTLSEGAAQIGDGDLTKRIVIETGDELEALGNQFNSMAMQLQESYATLERKVEERTRQLEIANQAKSRFLATASHDLRQPLHALGLFVAQLRGRTGAEDRKRIVAGIEAAVRHERAFQCAAGHFQAGRRRAGAEVERLSDCAIVEADRDHFRRSRSRKRIAFARRCQRFMGAQRLHPPGADRAQPRIERNPLYGGRRRASRLPPGARMGCASRSGTRASASRTTSINTFSASSTALKYPIRTPAVSGLVLPSSIGCAVSSNIRSI